VLMTRGCGWFAPPKALASKRLAATVSRLAESKKSTVAPVESTARYKYTHLPLIRMKCFHISFSLLFRCNQKSSFGLLCFQRSEERLVLCISQPPICERPDK
jgi:hypothetical protein